MGVVKSWLAAGRKFDDCLKNGENVVSDYLYEVSQFAQQYSKLDSLTDRRLAETPDPGFPPLALILLIPPCLLFWFLARRFLCARSRGSPTTLSHASIPDLGRTHEN